MNEVLGIKRGTLNGWIRVDGHLRKPAAAVSRLPNYVDEHKTIRKLLTELGHGKAAARLPEATLPRQAMSAEVIAETLTMMAERPSLQLAVIATHVGIGRSSLVDYLGPGAKALQFDKIAALVDYEKHVVTIRNSLRRMGQHNAAAALRPPTSQVILPSTASVQARIPAKDFLRQADAALPQIVAVAKMMRDNPTVAMETALSLVEVSKPVVRLFLDERGAVRDAPDVLQHVENAREDTKAGLSGLLERIAQQLGLTGTVSSIRHPMKTLRLRNWCRVPAKTADDDGTGRMQEATTRKLPKRLHEEERKAFFIASDRMLIVDHRTAEREAGGPDQLQRIFAQNASRVHGPRSHEANRPRQVLRWLSTVLKAQDQFRDGTEIQCYFEPRHGVVVVSSNCVDINDRMHEFLMDGGLERLLNEPVSAAPASEKKYHAPRQERHQEKLATRMDPASDPHPTAQTDALFRAIAERRFHVPLCNGDGAKFLHAERRIANYVHEELESPVNLDLLAGTMRPCGTCANELKVGPGHHRGPFWMSKAARGGLKGQDDIDRNAREGLGTSITRNRAGRLTFDHDTDSDSDVAPATPARDPSATPPRVATQAKRTADVPSTAAAGQASAPTGATRPLARGDYNFIEAYLGQTVSGVRQARRLLGEQVLSQVSDFNDRSWHRDEVYASVETVMAAIRTDTGMDVARAVRIAHQLGHEDLGTLVHALTVRQRNTELQALQDQAVTAHQLLAGLGVAVDMPEDRQQTEQVLQQLVNAGSQRYLEFMRRPDEPTLNDRQDLLQIGQQAARLRRSATLLGWLSPEASPTHRMPVQGRPRGEMWSESQVRALFDRGSASGIGNNCWFDAIAQLSLGERRGSGADDAAIELRAERLRLGADRLGLSSAGDMFDDDNGAMHLIARAVNVQVHVFREQPDGTLQMSALQSVGAPRSRPVYIRSDDVHFVPMWPRRWAAAPRTGPGQPEPKRQRTSAPGPSSRGGGDNPE